MVEEIFEKYFELIFHIFLHITKLTHFGDIYEKHVDFLIFNHKFSFNTKMNKVENNKVKPKYIYENDIMKGQWDDEM